MGDTANRGVIVTAAATGINLALGILYTWSIFKCTIRDSIEQGGGGAFSWQLSSLNDPYAVCCLVFAFAMILAGKCQDVWGPRKTAVIGGILVGLGFSWISQTTDYTSWIIGFGGLARIREQFQVHQDVLALPSFIVVHADDPPDQEVLDEDLVFFRRWIHVRFLPPSRYRVWPVRLGFPSRKSMAQETSSSEGKRPVGISSLRVCT